MINQSTAPLLAEKDGLTALERASRNKLMLGLFLPIQNCGWSGSSAPRSTTWHFDYNARLAVRADELGFDLAFGLALWTGKGGMGGNIKYWETTLDPLTTTAGLVPLTRNILLISTIHILYGLHPLNVAKFGATLAHMSGGRWGINMVTGYAPGEFQKFGKEQIDHDLRYVMASEFTEFVKKLWSSDENLTIDGSYWKMKDAYCTPKPGTARPTLVCAATSPSGIEFGAEHCDLIFITSPAGAHIDDALSALPAHTDQIRQAARRRNRHVKTLINPLVICRETEREVKEVYDRIVQAEDKAAVDGIMRSQRSGDNQSWRGHLREQRTVGGNIQLFGTPDQIADWCVKLQKSGVDGIQLSFFDFAPDLEYFGSHVLPLLKQAGLRSA